VKPATAKQKQLLHVLPDRLGMTDEERRAMIAARTGKRSAADLTHREATLLLDTLFAMQRGQPLPTWRSDGATRWELEALGRLRQALGDARFDGLARRLSKGRTDNPAMMSGREARALLQAARSICEREGIAVPDPGADRHGGRP